MSKQVTLIYVPVHLGGSHRGASIGPAALRVADLAKGIELAGWKVASEVDVSVPDTLCWFEKKSPSRCVPEISQVSQELALQVEAALAADTMPISVGGDHSLAIGSIAGVANYFRKKHEKFGLIWFDAHGDINTPETSSSGNVHGMPLAVSLGHGDKRLVEINGYSPKVDAKRSALIGIRDLDPPERELINQTGIAAYTMHDIDQLGIAEVVQQALDKASKNASGIHLSFDIDVLDPEIAPGVSTQAMGGINYREITLALSLIAKSGLLRSIDIVELNPTNDVRNRTAELAVELVATCLGKRII